MNPQRICIHVGFRTMPRKLTLLHRQHKIRGGVLNALNKITCDVNVDAYLQIASLGSHIGRMLG
jgi:hypothetical protein